MDYHVSFAGGGRIPLLAFVVSSRWLEFEFVVCRQGRVDVASCQPGGVVGVVVQDDLVLALVGAAFVGDDLGDLVVDVGIDDRGLEEDRAVASAGGSCWTASRWEGGVVGGYAAVVGGGVLDVSDVDLGDVVVDVHDGDGSRRGERVVDVGGDGEWTNPLLALHFRAPSLGVWA